MTNQEQSIAKQNRAIHALTTAQPQFLKISDQNKLVKWSEESQFAMQAIMRSPRLQDCTPESIQDAVINVATVGLTLNPADGYAYLVPEYNKQTNSNLCELRISFKGLIKAVTDSGAIKWCRAEVVKANDTFEYHGPTKEPTHTMDPFGDRGNSIGVYCIAKTSEDDILTDVMSWEEVERIKACAKTQTIWNKWPNEMAKKAMVKRAQKLWPKTQQSGSFHQAIQVLNKSEGSDFSEMEQIQKTADYIIEKLADGDLLAVGEAWTECTQREMELLWVAKTKGGFFTQQEKVKIREAAAMYKKANAEDPIEGEVAES